jgi:hypothetical protein
MNNMKKYLIGLVILVSAGMSSCKKVDNPSVFDQTADQRLTAALAAYEAKLAGATDGWKGALTTNTGGIYTFYFKFNNSNRVQMLSSFDSSSAVTFKESSYRLKALQQPSLLFDTYSYIHVLSDPNNAISGGSGNVGLISDFEFYFEDTASTADKITLVGRFNGSSLVLTRATAAEATAFTTGQLAAGLQLNKIQTYFQRIVINGTDSTDVHIDALKVTLAGVDAQGNLLDASKKASYFLTLGGLGLTKAIPVGTKTMTEISNVTYSTTTGFVSATIGGQPAVIKPVAIPLKVDLGAPARWLTWTKNSVYVKSPNGFHQNGVEDAFSLKTTIPFYSYVRYDPLASPPYDAFRVLVTLPTGLAAFGPAVTPTFPTDGRVLFPNSGLGFGAASAPTSGTALANYNKFRNQVWQAQGYYAVQTTAGSTNVTTYDLVSVADSKTWISWFY